MGMFNSKYHFEHNGHSLVEKNSKFYWVNNDTNSGFEIDVKMEVLDPRQPSESHIDIIFNQDSYYFSELPKRYVLRYGGIWNSVFYIHYHYKSEK